MPETPTTTARSATLAPGRCNLFLMCMLNVYYCDHFQYQTYIHMKNEKTHVWFDCVVLFLHDHCDQYSHFIHFRSMFVPVENIPTKQRAWPKIRPVNFAKQVSTPPSKRPMPSAIAKHAWRGSITTVWAPTATACAKHARPAKPNQAVWEKRTVCPVNQENFNHTLVPPRVKNVCRIPKAKPPMQFNVSIVPPAPNP